MRGIITAMAQSNIELPEEYGTFLESMKVRVRSARLQAVRTVNTELIQLYWALGRAILDRQEQQGWGAKVIDTGHRLRARHRDRPPSLTALGLEPRPPCPRAVSCWCGRCPGTRPAATRP